MRGKPVAKRIPLPDYKYQRVIVSKLINVIMHGGKKTIAEKIVYGAFDLMSEKSKQDPLEVFDQALKHVTPSLEVKSRRVGGSNYQIPVEVRGERAQALALRWLIGAARSRKGTPMKNRLAEEFLAAAQNEGDAVKKRQDVQRMAEANRAFAHFA
ncbi:MAG: 30S ribosomal protein S7 [Patescibacteria group bacterium]